MYRHLVQYFEAIQNNRCFHDGPEKILCAVCIEKELKELKDKKNADPGNTKFK